MKRSNAKRIRVLLVDDHPIVREGIKAHLSAQPDLQVVGEASDGREALGKAREHRPDVILMDITMPHMNGLEAIARLQRKAPDAKILVLTMHDNREYIAQSVRFGARGYLRKDTSPADLVRAIKSIHAGEVCFSATASRVVADEFLRKGQRGETQPPLLSDRERDVLVCIAEGSSNKEVADRLGIGVRTAETHRERLMRKLNIHTVAGLTKFAIANGMVNLDPVPPKKK